MLVLIVVIAASAFAVFISQQQKIAQDNQLIKDEKAGESILISSLNAIPDSNDKYWVSLNITVSSMNKGTSEIDRVSINNHVLQFYNLTMLNTANNWVKIPMNYTSKWILQPQQVVQLNVTMSDFFGLVTISTSSPISYILFTAYSNEFTKVLYPPTSIISVNTETQWDGSITNPDGSLGNYLAVLILDGSQSDQPGDTTIVKWSWSVDIGATNYLHQDGRKVRFDPSLKGVTYTITLVVENANGMIGTSMTTYTN